MTIALLGDADLAQKAAGLGVLLKDVEHALPDLARLLRSVNLLVQANSQPFPTQIHDSGYARGVLKALHKQEMCMQSPFVASSAVNCGLSLALDSDSLRVPS